MSELELDGPLSDAVADYRAQTAARVTPPGVAAIRATAEHRRRVHTIAGGMLVAVALIAPVATYAAIGHGHRGSTPVVGQSSPTLSGPSPSGPVWASPSGPPTPPAPIVTPPPGPVADLWYATLDLPGWGRPDCPHGPTKFVAGSAGKVSILNALATRYGPDGSSDVVALLGCQVNTDRITQAVAFHLDGSVVHTIGVVVTPNPAGAPFDDSVWTVLGLAGDAVGQGIAVIVGDYEMSLRGFGNGVQETRIYAWNGNAFTQVGGPTTFRAPGTVHLSLTTGPVHFNAANFDQRHGTVTVTVHNDGSVPVDNVSVLVADVPDGIVDMSACGLCHDDPAHTVSDERTIGARSSVTFTVSLFISASDADALIARGGVTSGSSFVQVRVSGRNAIRQAGLGTATFSL